MTTAYDFRATSLTGKAIDLKDYRGQVLIVVNTASKCGFTPQYKGLEELYQSFRERGVVVLGFPCNQFGKQEPGGSNEIGEFCEINYGVSFPMFEKIDVNGHETAPLYQFLKDSAPGILGSKKIKWNFTKFLVDKEGQVVRRYAPTVKPSDMYDDIEELLQA